MKDNFINIFNMDLEPKYHQQKNTNTLAILKMMLSKVMDKLYIKMEVHMMDCGKMVNLMDKDIIKVQQCNTKADGNKISFMDMVKLFGQMVENIKEVMFMVKSRVMEFILIQMVNSMSVNGYLGFNMVMDKFIILMGK